jgi:hypothetical protein
MADVVQSPEVARAAQAVCVDSHTSSDSLMCGRELKAEFVAHDQRNGGRQRQD